MKGARLQQLKAPATSSSPPDRGLASLQRRAVPGQGWCAKCLETGPRRVAQVKQARGIFGGTVQSKLGEMINASPRLAAQAQRKAALFGTTQLQQIEPTPPLPHPTKADELHQLKAATAAMPAAQAASAPNRTGLPNQLKAGIEALSGISLDVVKVHFNSAKPAQLHAHAYAQGTDIHLAPGQEKHLPHEAWHVVQQAQGRVRPTLQMKGGPLINDDAGLEHEADVMGRRAANDTGGFAAQLLREPSLSGEQPLQCQLWRWYAHSLPPHWAPQGASSSTAVPPTHAGTYDGELFDDQPYTQATDPTIRPFLRSGEDFMGQKGADRQLSGQKPLASEIRVSAVKSPGLLRGSGLHEGVPTNLGPQLASAGNESLIGAQSGFRTSTGKQMFNIGGGEVGAHTGFAPNLNGRGYSHTKGQPDAHDKMRDAIGDLITTNQVNPDDVANTIAIRHLEVTPHGQAVLASPFLQGMVPNDNHGLGAVGPVALVGPPDPQRLQLAQEAQLGREALKRRVRTHKRATTRGRSPSPPRAPIDALGGGGGYVQNPTLADQVEALPFLPNTNSDFEYVANLTAWMSQPQRF
jgi:Domain of unknown function (DUF4157)